MKKISLLFLAIVSFLFSPGQASLNLGIDAVDEKNQPVPHYTAELFRADSTLVKIQVAGNDGRSEFSVLPSTYLVRLTKTGYLPLWVRVDVKDHTTLLPAVLHTTTKSLTGITITAKKPFIELKAGKTIVNVESGITTIGSTAMEALEKMPGIVTDKDGNISLKGKSGVTIMIDGKPTYLDPAQLATLLNGMSASQISQVEIMENPPARFDAAGNAGVINIKTKKTRQKGFNGSITGSYGQGSYYKNNNNIQLNYRSGKWNLFANYSINNFETFSRIYAFRRYFEPDDITIQRQLEQPSFIKYGGHTHNVRLGLDFSFNEKTTVGVGLNSTLLNRNSRGNSIAEWMNASGHTDSVIQTNSNSAVDWDNAGFNLNFRHAFTVNRELSADLDMIGYRISNGQFFNNLLLSPSTYTEASRANIPNEIRIVSAKADYSEQFQKIKLEAGWKSSRITTDNLASYEYLDANTWKDDLGKSNHFIYKENIHALYSSVETRLEKWTLQGGLRYEMTNYNAHQLGNAIVKDSAFSKDYNSLFPSFFTSWQMDSSNSFSFSAGRRIDRPAFQKLNPFSFIINKYTYQQGNPYYRPQYTWNMEISHSFQNKFLTSISYSTTKDYFSQVFPVDSNGIVLYTEGNLGRLQNFGVSAGVQLSPKPWWSFQLQAVLNHKKMEGFIEKEYRASITQVNISFNNQLRFQKGWSAELSGFYTSKSQHDIQEVVDPAGQLSIGLAKNILNNKGSLKLAVRDLFYTQWMKGNTLFTRADEYFKLTRDTRVATISFSYRFGKAFKSIKRSKGSANEELERVGNG